MSIIFHLPLRKDILPDTKPLGSGDGTFERPGTPYRTDRTTGLLTKTAANTARHEFAGDELATLIEPGGQNLIQYSHELSDAASSWWIDKNLTRVIANGMIGPFGTTTMDGVVATVDNDNHNIETPRIAGITQSDKCVVTVYAKKGNKNWVFLEVGYYNAGDAFLGDEGGYYFDVLNGSIGAKVEAGNMVIHDYMIEPLDGGIYRIGMVVSNTDADTAKIRYRIYSAQADNDKTFVGDTSTVTAWFEGADLKIRDTFDSHVVTSGGTASRITEEGQPHYKIPLQGNGGKIFETELGAEEATGTLTIGNVYKITATAGGDYFYTGDAVGGYFEAEAETALDGTHKVQEVTNAYNGKPPVWTMAEWIRPGFNEEDVDADGAFISLADQVAGPMYHDVSGNGIACQDSDSSEATYALAFDKDTSYLMVTQAQLNSNVYQIRVGAKKRGDTFGAGNWGSWTNYSGNIDIGGDEFQIGYGLKGPFHISDVVLVDEAWSNTEIDAWPPAPRNWHATLTRMHENDARRRRRRR